MKKRAHEIKLGDTILIKLSKDSFPGIEEKVDFVSNSKKLLKNFKKEVEKDFGFTLRFEVDDIDMEYINDEVSDLYGETEEPLPEHVKYTFYHEDMDMFNIEDFSGSSYEWEVE
jgi:hypothetical protein